MTKATTLFVRDCLYADCVYNRLNLGRFNRLDIALLTKIPGLQRTYLEINML